MNAQCEPNTALKRPVTFHGADCAKQRDAVRRPSGEIFRTDLLDGQTCDDMNLTIERKDKA